jgi:hypothetical protein
MKQVIRKESVIIKNLNNDTLNARIRFTFPNNENLRNVQLWGVQCFYGTQLHGGQIYQDPDYSQDILNKYIFQHLFITLYDKKNVEFIKRAPLVIFQTIQDTSIFTGGGKNMTDIVERDPKTLNGQLLDLQNSYLELFTTGLKPFQNQSILINFYYSRIDLEKVKPKKQLAK